MFESPGPVAFEIGHISIYWYGIIIAAAFLSGLAITTKIAEKQGENPENILDLAIYLLIGSLISARAYFVIFDWKYFIDHFSETFMTWKGGLSIHGAIIGGFIVVYIYTKIKKLSLLKYADILSYGAILGQAIGRWGNFFNSEAFGSPTNLPWKLYIPLIKRPLEYSHYQYFHPTFLYESLWNLLVFFILYKILRKKFNNFNGAIFFSYLILYSSGRFIIESIRIDSIYSVFGLPIAQLVSIICILIGIGGLVYVIVNKKRTGH